MLGEALYFLVHAHSKCEAPIHEIDTMWLFILWNRILAEEQTCLSHEVDSQVWWAVMKSYEKCKKWRRQDDMYFLISPVKISSQHSVWDFWWWNSFHLQFERPNSRNENKKESWKNISLRGGGNSHPNAKIGVHARRNLSPLNLSTADSYFPLLGLGGT